MKKQEWHSVVVKAVCAIVNDKVIMVAVFINALIIFISGFDFVPNSISYIDNLFAILFIIEAVVKINICTFRGYIRSSWNRFDFLVTLLGSLSLINMFTTIDIGPINIVFSLRILRILRSFRLIKFVPEVSSIINGARRALRSSIIVILTFVLMVFIVAIFSNALFEKKSPEYFANPLVSVYSIFQLFTGDGWSEIANSISKDSTIIEAFFIKLYFSILLFVGCILGISLVNSIFVDAMTSDSNNEILEKLEQLEQKINNLKN